MSSELPIGEAGYAGYEVRVVRLAVLPLRDPLFSEQATMVTIDDELNGEFVRVTQQSMSVDVDRQEILIEPKEWPAFKSAIDYMVYQCRKETA